MEVHNKLEALKLELKNMGGVAVAYSGGVDSTFLLKVAHDVLKDDVIGVTARSSTYPEREFKEASDFAKQAGIRHIVIVSEELDIEGFSSNPVDRCYHCKKELYEKIWEVAKANHIKYIIDGSNMSDLDDYRPGMVAVRECNVVSPLKKVGMTKEDIRILSREMGLSTWNKPAFACLASRFPYGKEITKEKLEKIDIAEQYLLDVGFKQVRVRFHDEVARIEVAADERSKFFNEEIMDNVHNKFKQIGFKYTALDLKGYRTGSMNEGLKIPGS